MMRRFKKKKLDDRNGVSRRISTDPLGFLIRHHTGNAKLDEATGTDILSEQADDAVFVWEIKKPYVLRGLPSYPWTH